MRGFDEELSILGFGCMRLPTTGGKVDEPTATGMLHHAIDAGVNYIDTAWPYHDGESEWVVGRALSHGQRDKVHLATKLPSWLIHSREDMDRYLSEQLTKLRTDHIDYYLIHAIGAEDWERLDGLGIRGFIKDALTGGRILHAGFSSHDTTQGVKRVIDSYDWEFCQLQYNFLDETYQAGTEGLSYAAAKGLGVIVMEPLRGGMLAKPLPAVMGIWSEAPTRRSLAEWGMRWVWNHPDVTVVLSGMSEPGQLTENLRIADAGHPNSLSADELGLFENAKSVYRSRMGVGCTTCAYCMPCPNGVDIPECFAQYNSAFMFDDRESAQRVYDIRSSRGGCASSCTECRTCVDLCPQHIDVPERLKDVVRLFGK